MALFNKVTFLLSAGFFLAGAVMTPYYAPRTADGGVTWAGPLFHFATLLVSLFFWQLCRRRPGLPGGLLRVIDGASLALPLLGFSLQAPWVPGVGVRRVLRRPSS